ncbi:MAG: DUF6702 family protein [Bacteroidota bacterium]
MKILAYIIGLTLFGSSMHPMHISVCEIVHDEDSKALQITQRIFLDDLEDALKLRGNLTGFDIMNPDDPKLIDKMLKDYYAESFEIMLGKKPAEIKYLGSEIDKDVMWCYLEVQKVKKVENIQVSNTILMDLFDDQTNIIHVSYDGKIKTMKLQDKNRVDQVIF